MWAVQMLWIPFFAADVVNGVGHYWGYRSFAPNDDSRNVVPWGILIGGEELHNNHHAYVTSARLSSKGWEFDIGWMYIRILEMLRLAKVRTVAPGSATTPPRPAATQTPRRRSSLTAITCSPSLPNPCSGPPHRNSVACVRAGFPDRRTPGRWTRSSTPCKGMRRNYPEKERTVLDQALHSSKVLSTIYSMRQELSALWSRSTASKEQLVKQLEDWCRRAEESGIGALREFSRTLRRYDSPLGDRK